MSSRLPLLATAAIVSLATAPAQAAPPEGAEAPAEPEKSPKSEADALSEEAVTAFQAKDYETAVTKFEAAYEVDPNPNYLFNIGRVHEEAGNLATAVEFYEKFVGSSGVDLDSRKIAHERLEVLKPIVEAEKEPESTEQPEAGPDPEPVDPVDPVDAKKRKNVRITGYVLLGVGGGAVVAGGVVGGMALSRKNSLDDANSVQERKDDFDSARTLGLTADGLLIAGGVVAATGLVMVLTSLDRKRDSRSASRTMWAPTVNRRGAGVGVAGRF